MKHLSKINFIYNLAIKIMATRTIWSNEALTPEYLQSKGWVKEGDFWVESNIKERDKIWVSFEAHYYRVYHGELRSFIGLHSTKEWFDTYYLLVADRETLYKLAGI